MSKYTGKRIVLKTAAISLVVGILISIITTFHLTYYNEEIGWPCGDVSTVKEDCTLSIPEPRGFPFPFWPIGTESVSSPLAPVIPPVEPGQAVINFTGDVLIWSVIANGIILPVRSLKR